MIRRSFGETNCCWGVKVKVTWQLGEEGVKDRWEARWGRWKGKRRWKEIEDLFGLLVLLEHARWSWNKVETCRIQTRFFKGLRKETTQFIKQIVNNLSLKVFDILSKNMIISLFIYHAYHSCSTNLVKIIKFFWKKKKFNSLNLNISKISTTFFKHIKSSSKFQSYIMFWTSFDFLDFLQSFLIFSFSLTHLFKN
jgi:hypothetical protein